MTKKYIIAVSGGPDSMCLLDKYKKSIIGACHVNYHKRVDSNHDTVIVKSFCKKNNIPLMIRDVDKKEYSRTKLHNFQDLARKIRYDFFVECSKKFKCNNLLIAHNLNDFLETAIMQKNRKSLNFFYGIKRNNKYQTLNIYRPLIEKFKQDLEDYCKKHNIDYAIDSSNSSDIYERNRIRKQLNKKSRAELLKLYELINERNEAQAKIEQEAQKLLLSWSKNNYSTKFIKSIDKSIQVSVLYLYLKTHKITNINYNKIILVRDFIVSNKSNCMLRLEENVSLLKKNKMVRIISNNDK